MDTRLDVVVSLMERLSGEFQDLKETCKELKESFKELKEENAVLRKEILGIGASAASFSQKGMGLMERTTLRELVEQIQFDVKSLNAKAEKSLQEEEYSGKGNKSSAEKQRECDVSSADNDVDKRRDPVERFPVVEIKSRTMAEQRDWMKKAIAEFTKESSLPEGASFGGRTLQAISSSIFPNPTEWSTSCTIKLSNHLSYALTDTRFNFLRGSLTRGPSKVDPHVSEVFTLLGHEYWDGCQFMCSIGISSSLRLTIYSDTDAHGKIQLGMAFTPQDVPIDLNLLKKLIKMSAPDIWMRTYYSEVPLEVIIHHGKLHARGHKTPERFSVIQIDIMEVSSTESVIFPVGGQFKPLEDGQSVSATLTSRNRLRGSTLNKIICIIEIGNCLNCTLKNPSAYFCNRSRDKFLPSEILPFYRERFLVFDKKTVEAMFSYEIESTDLCLVVALRAESGNNSFTVAFAQFPVYANGYELVALMDPEAWKTHLYKKYAHAKDGEQVIEIRNIRASVKMTEDAKSLLSIRVFAV